ncbi:Arginine biosynthesis bifunctional protein ArgJ, mitochondrial [Elasticomyces elasticus]|nr:Arginine biosynthesis bifunctional protein ArgJ, mitochondrial [Elasticomyces elasticus]KAK4923868.1 Arginine biosynthesis bifunctional protein ArgJ, mitochondrial [Elasticomyces elasticus]KAK5754823.1 Arginine biosynthesis bifunctional protein ArgJ, mitochondrial [Elasticomyces elasticus]
MAPTGRTLKRVFAAAFQIRTYSAPAERTIPAAKQKYVPTTGTYPKGFLAGTSHAGVKASNTSNDDITMIVSDQLCAAGGVFTKNIFKAAPVQASRRFLSQKENDNFRGVIVNSGCANAVTGKLGQEHAAIMAQETDKCFEPTSSNDIPQTLVMSTGVIGQRLPIDKITAAIPKAHKALGTTHEHWLNAAKAICTTDTFPKLISRTFTLPSHPDTTYSIAGMTKGAGMIHPNMATLLAIVCTDVKIAPSSIGSFLRFATNRTFNCISIDGDTSTNDTVNLFANGMAAPEGTSALSLPPALLEKRSRAYPFPSPPQDPRSPDAEAFTEVLTDFMRDLAKLVVRDGEGATKFVTIRVTSDLSHAVAKRAAVSIARSALVKTALYGKDANWGRILCAIGYAPGIMDAMELPAITRAPYPVAGAGAKQVVPERTSVSFIPTDGSAELKLLVRGEPETVDEERAKQILEMEDLEILVKLDDGPALAEYERDERVKEAIPRRKQHDHEYVTINGDYRT